jgi:hypothetical protein
MIIINPLILTALMKRESSTEKCRFLKTNIATVPKVGTGISVLQLFSGCSSVVHL